MITHNYPYRGSLGSVVSPTPINRDKPNRSVLPSYDSVIVVGENDGLPSYNQAIGLSRDTIISLHM